MNYCVYIHTNKINKKSYVGITCQRPERRWRNGNGYVKKNQPIFYNAIQKYGWDNFEHIIFADGLSEEEAKNYEKHLIALYKTNVARGGGDAQGYNSTDGGEGFTGHKHSEKTRKKISEAGKGREVSEETREKIRQSHLGRKCTEEQRKHMSDAKKGENHPNWGKHRSEETKKKISQSRKKPIRNKTLDIIYDSAMTIEKELGFDHSLIARVCQGKRKTAYGYEWEYYV